MHKILIVDDEKSIREELSDFLIDDYEVATAGSSTEAMECLDGVEVAIIDMYMEKEKSGIELLKKVKESQPSTQCIVLTAYGTAVNAVEAMKSGAYDYVEKQTPGIYEALEHRIKRALEHRENIEALQKSEERYHTLIENLNEVIYTTDIQGYITYISPILKRYTGYETTEITGKHFSELIHPEDLPDFKAKFQSIINDKKGIFEFRMLDKNNEIHFIRSSNHLLMTNENESLIGSLTDITEQRQAEEQRKEAERKLLESNRALEKSLATLKATQEKIIQQERLRDMGQLASGIAHDFNNILTPILGYSDYILTNPEMLKDKKTVIPCLEMIRNAATDAAELISNLGKFYRKHEDNEDLLPVNLKELIQQAILITQPKWKNQTQANGITINILADLQDTPLINGKESELREVLTNLIFNSVDAITSNGIISLSTQTNGKEVILEVKDTGIGMTEESKMRCFEPFFSTKGNSGIGIGLALVYSIIQRHEGTIEVESEAGKGTTFTIRLPIAKEIKHKPKADKVNKKLRRLNVLVVDDEPSIQDMLGKYLSIDKHTFEKASNGREGLAKFKDSKFDVVITDRAMPDIGGEQLAEFIKQIEPKVPVIMITGFGCIMEATGELPKNVDCLIGKPFTLASLRKALMDVYA